jgi:hypothetical protein
VCVAHLGQGLSSVWGLSLKEFKGFRLHGLGQGLGCRPSQ